MQIGCGKMLCCLVVYSTNMDHGVVSVCAISSLGFTKWKFCEFLVGYECMALLSVKKSLKDSGRNVFVYMYT